MNEKVLQVLEFNKIRQRLSERAFSSKAREAALELKPFENIYDIERAQTETEDAVKRIFAKGSLSFSGTKDVLPALRHALQGGVMTSRELLDTAVLLETVKRAKSYASRDEAKEDYVPDSLEDMFSCLEPDEGFVRRIRSCILEEDVIADDASAELKSIRRKMKDSSSRIRTTLQSLISGSLKSYLMDSVYTIRNNRYCVPVRSEYKSQVPGMIHDQSSTGSTLFIEPQAIVRLNNEIKELELQEKAEILAILSDLSATAASHEELIRSDYQILTELDFIFAKAQLSCDMDALRPQFNTAEIIRLKGARHPLIDGKKVVPIDIELGKTFDLLVVTGPNTGGKTVSLKTVGLLELMGLSGLHIPARDGSELSFFREIYADIGDEQSIEQSLSTFSSHMTNIVSMLKSANIMSLCLFDELGAGTDPTEGAALAASVLSYLHKKSIRTIATTHYSELKEYALTTPWVENACCEFDVETLRPTYRILVGVPGRSNAFAISSRLGLPDFIIEDAKKRIGEEDKKFEKLLESLENNRIELEKKREQIERESQEIERMQKSLDSGRTKLEDSREKILSDARRQAREILEEAKSTADETIRNMMKYADTDSIRAAERDRSRIRESLKKTDSSNPDSIRAAAGGEAVADPGALRLGDKVVIASMNLKGQVVSLPDSRGNLFVQCGILKYRTKVSDLLYDRDSRDSKESIKFARGEGQGKGLSHAMTISTELKLIGMTGDEAREALSSYLDEAYLSHLDQVRIVHGKGTGVLRKVVRDYLKKCRYVKSFRSGEFGEGDSGVTIAALKE